MIESSLPERHVWLRLTQSRHRDAFDMSYARERGGRWNPPESWPTLYLNDDLATVHAQVRHLFAGRGIDPDDLDDTAPIELAAATMTGNELAWFPADRSVARPYWSTPLPYGSWRHAPTLSEVIEQ